MQRVTYLLIILMFAETFLAIKSEALPGKNSASNPRGQNATNQPGTTTGNQPQGRPQGKHPPIVPHRRVPDVIDKDISKEAPKTKHEFDRLVLVQSWLKASCCKLNPNIDYKNSNCTKCNFTGTENDWMLHGLWPSYKDTTGPEYCKSNHTFRFRDLNESLQDDMNQKWRSANHQFETAEGFWRHEWNKHGTCAAQLPQLSTISAYFSKALLLLDTYRVGKFLSEAKITPNIKNMYDYHDIYYAIRHGLGHKPIINCVDKDKNKLLYEVRICFSKTFHLIDCPDERTTNCFYLPKIQYH